MNCLSTENSVNVNFLVVQLNNTWMGIAVNHSSFSFPFPRIDGKAIGLEGNLEVTAVTLPDTMSILLPATDLVALTPTSAVCR